MGLFADDDGISMHHTIKMCTPTKYNYKIIVNDSIIINAFNLKSKADDKV